MIDQMSTSSQDQPAILPAVLDPGSWWPPDQPALPGLLARAPGDQLSLPGLLVATRSAGIARAPGARWQSFGSWPGARSAGIARAPGDQLSLPGLLVPGDQPALPGLLVPGGNPSDPGQEPDQPVARAPGQGSWWPGCTRSAGLIRLGIASLARAPGAIIAGNPSDPDNSQISQVDLAVLDPGGQEPDQPVARAPGGHFLGSWWPGDLARAPGILARLIRAPAGCFGLLVANVINLVIWLLVARSAGIARAPGGQVDQPGDLAPGGQISRHCQGSWLIVDVDQITRAPGGQVDQPGDLAPGQGSWCNRSAGIGGQGSWLSFSTVRAKSVAQFSNWLRAKIGV